MACDRADFGLVLSLALLPIVVFGQSVPITLNVETSVGAKVAYADVVIQQLGPPARTFNGQTGKTGWFEMGGLPPGKYNITVRKQGYRPTTQEIVTQRGRHDWMQFVLESVSLAKGLNASPVGPSASSRSGSRSSIVEGRGGSRAQAAQQSQLRQRRYSMIDPEDARTLATQLLEKKQLPNPGPFASWKLPSSKLHAEAVRIDNDDYLLFAAIMPSRRSLYPVIEGLEGGGCFVDMGLLFSTTEFEVLAAETDRSIADPRFTRLTPGAYTWQIGWEGVLFRAETSQFVPFSSNLEHDPCFPTVHQYEIRFSVTGPQRGFVAKIANLRVVTYR
jgi:hypothetical protein